MVLSSVPNPNESLARYLPEKSYFYTSKNSVRPKAFMPPEDLRLSVFRIDGLQLDEIWEMGQRKVIDATPQSKVLYGIADIKVSKVQQNNLKVDPDNNPIRHANIIGWPQEKERQKIIALELAAEADLILKKS